MSFYDIYQNARIGSAEATANESASKVEMMVRRVDNLERRLSYLTLVNMALWSLLEEKTPLTEADLMQRVKEIDQADGEVDDKIKTAPEPCAQCGYTLSKKHRRCLHCGHEPQQDCVFEKATR